METKINEILERIIKNTGYLKKNITISDVTIKSTKDYQELYKKSTGSYSDDGWCLFYTPPFSADKNKIKGTLHVVEKGVLLTTDGMKFPIKLN